MELFFSTTSKSPLMALEYYAYSVGSYHYNWHKQVELLAVLKGRLEVTCNGQTHSLAEDDIIWMNPGEGHTTFAHDADAVAFVLHFHIDLFTQFLNTPENVKIAYVSSEVTSHLAAQLRRRIALLIQAVDEEGLARELKVMSHVFDILRLVAEDPSLMVVNPVSRFRGKTEDPIKKIIQFIDRHYMEDISLEDLGKTGGYNANYVSQLFRKHLGITFYEYLTRIRLRQALIDLRDTDRSMMEVAARNGFADMRAFNHYFKSSFSKTPLQYRNSISSQHKEIDRVFKRNFIQKDDPVIAQKTQQYLQIQNENLVTEDSAGLAVRQRLNALESLMERIQSDIKSIE